jgi:hypothetical protein
LSSTEICYETTEIKPQTLHLGLLAYYNKPGYRYASYKKRKSIVRQTIFYNNILPDTGILIHHKLPCGLIYAA